MQLTDAPEGKSSLQSRLNEAERRAQDAEASAQDARAALARTLLDAAQVEAVVMARIKAESEAELEALRSELDAVRRAASTLESSLQDGLHAVPCADGGGQGDGTPDNAGLPPETSEDMAAVRDPAVAPACRPVEADSEKSVDDTGPAPLIHLRESDRPAGLSEDDEPDLDSKILRFLPPVRLALLAFLGVGVLVGYLSAASFMGGDKSPADALHRVADTVARNGDGTVRETPVDPRAIADASAALDTELSRLEALSRKVAALRTMLSERQGAESPMIPANPARTVAASIAAPADANWLLYMPVERSALVQYLAGGSWPGIQVAAKR